jgi:putative oxidoreductase
MKAIRSIVEWLFRPPLTAPRAALLVRLMTGGVFLSEGILKFVYTNQGVGRFAKLGLPFPEFTATCIGTLEIVGGLLLLCGLATRLFAILFIVEMIIAIATTKISLYFGTSPLPLPPSPPTIGWWAVLHESRSDWAQLLTSGFLLIAGPGPWSLDDAWQRWRQTRESSTAPERQGWARQAT